MKMRKISSLSALLSFLGLVTSSVVLYIMPHGRVAYWADWHLWGLTKTQWGNLHINLGLLFLISSGFHIYFNWKAILSYLKTRARQFRVFTREFNVAFLLLIVFVAGTVMEIAPLRWVLQLNDSIKNAASEKYGEPPYGHAELTSLKVFAKRMGLDLTEAMGRLDKAGISVQSENKTILQIAAQNRLSPQQVYLAMKPAEEPGRPKKMPPTAPPKTGNRTLADICHEYGLNIPTIIRQLAEANITATAQMTIKEIAAQNEISPFEIYEAIQRIAGSV